MKICVLGSGSKGNCTLIESGGTSLLIDAGFSGKEIRRRLQLIGRELEAITAVLVTHEHNDHVRGAGILSRQAQIPLYSNSATYKATGDRLGKLFACNEFGTGEQFNLNGLQVHPFAVSHDTADPVGFVITDGTHRFGYCTDTGKITTLIEHHLRDCDALVLESNHDPGMLRDGPYPLFLQQRVRSNRGHLANEDTGRFLKKMTTGKLRHVVLAHLSETNNLPELAMLAAVSSIGADTAHIRIIPAAQDAPTPVIDLSGEIE